MGYIYQPTSKAALAKSRTHACPTPLVRGIQKDKMISARWECDECGKRWIYIRGSVSCWWTRLRWWHKFTRPMRFDE